MVGKDVDCGVELAMNVGMVTRSLSRRGGGIFYSMQALALNVSLTQNVRAFGVTDEATDLDRASWNGVPTYSADSLGPSGFGYAPKLRSAVENAALDVLHVHGLWTYASVISAKWSVKTSKPYLVSPHGMLDEWALARARWKKKAFECLHERSHLTGAACLHALCDAEAEACRRYGLRNPICIIPNGVSAAPVAVDGSPKWRQPIPDRAKLLVYLGRLHPKKGLLPLVRAFREMCVAPAVPEQWHLIVAGWDQGGHESRLKAEAGELDGIRIHFIGPQFDSDKWALLRQADAFVLPSLSEGLPMAVLEAWSVGIPVLMTAACNLPEGFRAGAAICLESDSMSMSEALRRFCALSAERLVAMGLAGKTLVQQSFAWPSAAKAMCDVYNWVTLGGPAPQSVIKD